MNPTSVATPWRRVATMLALGSCALLLAGCGQKGPLTLPQAPAAPGPAASSPSR